MGNPHIGGTRKVVLAGFRDHLAAQHAVEVLARHRFPVEHVIIVGTGLRWKEQVTARWTPSRALLAGAGAGGWVGLLVGLVFWIVTPWAVWGVISGIVLGAVLGVVWAAIAYVMRQRSFAVTPVVVADRYDVLVDAEFADEARHILAASLPAALHAR